METRSRARESRPSSATGGFPERAPSSADQGATPVSETPQGETAFVGAVTRPTLDNQGTGRAWTQN